MLRTTEVHCINPVPSQPIIHLLTWDIESLPTRHNEQRLCLGVLSEGGGEWSIWWLQCLASCKGKVQDVILPY